MSTLTWVLDDTSFSNAPVLFDLARLLGRLGSTPKIIMGPLGRVLYSTLLRGDAGYHILYNVRIAKDPGVRPFKTINTSRVARTSPADST